MEFEIRRTRPSLYGTIAHGLGFWTDRSAVHEAAALGKAVQLQEMIVGGATVNIVAVDSITPLHEACIRGHTECVRLLLEAGALVDARNIDNSTPLCDACAATSPECVKLLLQYGAAVNPHHLTFSPLHEACMAGSAQCVQLMVDGGASLEAQDYHFGTPLHVACAQQNLDCVRVLLNAGANVNAVNLYKTPLHHAVKVESPELIDLLIECGGNIFARDNLGMKPIDHTTPESPCGLCLEFYQTTPLSLQQLCRISLRTALGARALAAYRQLRLPNRMIRFLSHLPEPVAQ